MGKQEMDREKAPTGSPWAFKVAKIAGIPIRIHFTFLLFLTWIAVAGRRQGDVLWPALVVAIFFCVFLHEMGHALMARKMMIPTKDITLYPIGGVAMLSKRPTPKQEFWITLAGPAVNVMIALAIGAYLFARDGRLPDFSLAMENPGILPGLFTANVALAIFNMIPAFPMDGGRILRSLLALNMDEAKATQIAGGIGQFLAILFGFLGLFSGNIIWMLIAFFVFLGAGQEVAMTVTRNMLKGHTVADSMQIRFRSIEHGATLQQAAEMLLEGSQQHFPVKTGEELVGVITRNQIIEGLAKHGPGGYVAGVMEREPRIVRPDLPLERIIDLFASDANEPILVLDGTQMVGMVTNDNLREFLALEEARRSARTYGYTS